jgi:hypothetical protein
MSAYPVVELTVKDPDVQELIEDRGVGMDARFSLVEGVPDATPAS